MPRASTLQICKSRTCSRWSASGSSIVWWMAAKCLVKSFVVSFANLGGLLKAQFRNLRECKGARNKFLEPQTGFSWCERGPSTWDRNLPVLIKSFVVNFATPGGLLEAQFQNLRERMGARNKFLEPQTGCSWCERGPSTLDRKLASSDKKFRRQLCQSLGASRGSISEPM